MPRIPHFKDIIARSPLVFVIGVAGDSGSGKTTFTNAIRQIFGPDLVATITLDDYHLYNREERKRLDITPLHPDANNLAQLETDVEWLRDGRAITKPVYNHETGTFDPPVPFASKKIIILEGLHTLFTPRSGNSWISLSLSTRMPKSGTRGSGGAIPGCAGILLPRSLKKSPEGRRTTRPISHPSAVSQMPSSASAVPGTGKSGGGGEHLPDLPPPAPDGPDD